MYEATDSRLNAGGHVVFIIILTYNEVHCVSCAVACFCRGLDIEDFRGTADLRPTGRVKGAKSMRACKGDKEIMDRDLLLLWFLV